MSEFLRRHSLLITSVVLVALCCQLMSTSIKNPSFPRLGGRFVLALLAPAQKFHHEALSSVNHAWDRYVALQNIEVERDELVERVKNLEAENSRLTEYRSENDRLRVLLDYRTSTNSTGLNATVVSAPRQELSASVIGQEASNWARTVTLDRGSKDGLREGLPVVDGNAVVGQIIAVSASSSKVLLLIDNTSAIDAIVQTSRAQGTVEGMLEEKLRLLYVLREYEINVGDRVIASGLDGIFPKGTLIGVVTRVEKGKSGLFQDIELEPSADLRRLENVFVVLNAAAGRG